MCATMLDASIDQDMWDIDGASIDQLDRQGEAEAPPAMAGSASHDATSGSRPSRAVLSRQKGSGEDYAASRKDLPLDAANVRRCVVSIHERTIELILNSRSGNDSSLLLKAVSEADCASWGRCLREAGQVETEWRQMEDMSSIL